MIRPVKYADIIDDPNAAALLHEYSVECSMPELGYANPQHEMYALLEATGGFQAFGVYDADRLVGFGSVLMHTIPHYGHKIATNESIFITPRIRNTGWGGLLMTAMEHHAKDKDGVVFLWTVPKGSGIDRKMANSPRHRHSNNVYVVSL